MTTLPCRDCGVSVRVSESAESWLAFAASYMRREGLDPPEPDEMVRCGDCAARWRDEQADYLRRDIDAVRSIMADIEQGREDPDSARVRSALGGAASGMLEDYLCNRRRAAQAKQQRGSGKDRRDWDEE